jgi:NAD(P)-dependent dehydrogenase (short-subunit alcohol dehydrogenase family)
MVLLKGKTAVITGSTKGIGRGIALELAREGAHVLLNHRSDRCDPQDVENVQETLKLIRKVSGVQPVVICEADMTNEEDARRLALVAMEAFGRIDIWVNNVGLHIVTPALEQSMAEWERLFCVNTTSVFLGCREAARIMQSSGGGSIINISSKMGMVGSPENACYCSAKAAVVMMTRCLAAEWAPYGIRVNTIAPGVTITDPTLVVVDGKPALEAALHYRTPLNRFAQPEEIGKVAVFLASELSTYVTGALIACDGGWTANGDFAGIPPEKIKEWEREFPRIIKK